VVPGPVLVVLAQFFDLVSGSLHLFEGEASLNW
jgi:hypothetical protein